MKKSEINNNCLDELNFKFRNNNIFNLDLDYRKQIFKYYIRGDCDLAHKVSLFWCAHYNVNKISEQIKSVLDNNLVQINENNLEDSFLNLCEFFSRRIKNEFQAPYPKELRLSNVKRINEKQRKDIIDKVWNRALKFILQKKDGKSFQTNYEFLNDRSLILYFRRRRDGREQVDYMDFSIMYYILDWYINSGFSKVFTKLEVVSRAPNQYPLYLNKLFPNLIYHSFTNKDESNVKKFTFHTSIGANKVFFVDSAYKEDKSYFTIPILSESIKYKSDDYPFLGIKKYVLLKGIFYDKKNKNLRPALTEIFRKDKRDRNTGNFEKLMRTILESVIELENLMITESKKE